jgi:hypothetical protein
VRVLNVETAAVAAQYRNDIKNDDRVQALLADRNSPTTSGINYATGPKRPTSTSTAAPLSPTESAAVGTEAPIPTPAVSVAENKAAPAADPKKVYKLGDTGPAGGLIFYDKEDYLDGWRYMEAAPADTEKKMAWWVQRYLKGVPPTKDLSVGNGKINTQELMNLVNENCGIYNNELPPILYCSTLEVNGYKDWFLPSVDELKLMRRNLHMKGLDKFNNERYWSSNIYSSWGISVYKTVYSVNFRYGEHNESNYDNILFVRAARRF